MHLKGTSSRPAIDGWVEKSGSFSLSVTTRVAERFRRTTNLRGKMERAGGMTVIKGSVSSGASQRGQIMIFVAVALVGVMMIASGSPALALALIPVGLALYVPLRGDADNSEYLMSELQKTLAAKPTLPKATRPAPVATTRTTTTAKVVKAGAAKPATTAGTAKPAASKSKTQG
jgi:hypothetical protein